MAERRFSDFVPRWAREGASNKSSEFPFTGTQPALAPLLPIRLLPHSSRHSITAMTLGQIATTTQRILTYASYEAVHGVSPDFSDLRSVGPEVAALAQLNIEPFEEGSFVIPSRLSEDERTIAGRSLSGTDVLSRFVEAMDRIAKGDANLVSIGMLQTVEDLGRITRREAVIEYSAFGIEKPWQVVVDSEYIAKATKAKEMRRSTRQIPDSLTGVVTAVDLESFTFALKVSGRVTVAGNYVEFLKDKMAASLGQTVYAQGVVRYDHNDTPMHIHAIDIESIDNEPFA